MASPTSQTPPLQGAASPAAVDALSANAGSHSGGSSRTIGARIIQNTLAQLTGRVVGILLSAVTSILLARYLGVERMGNYGAIYAYLSLYSFLATFGLDQILAREAAQRRAAAAQIFHTGTLAALGFAVVGALLAPSLAPLFGYTGPVRWLIAIAAIDILIFPPCRLPGIIFQVDMKQWFAVGIGLFRQLLWLVAVVLLAFHNAAFYQVIIARTLCGFLEAAISLKLPYRRGFLTGPRRFDWAEARMMLRAGVPLVLSSVAVGIYHRIDQVMLHKMSGDRVLGPYIIAVQLVEIFSVLPVALMSSMFPLLAQSAADEDKFRYYMDASYRLLLVVVFAACATITPIIAPLIEFFYGKEYLATVGLLNVLIWSEVPIFFGVVINSAIIARGLQRHLPASTAVGASTNVLLNLAMIPRYGALGASWATVVSYCLAGIFLFLASRKTRPLALQGLRIGLFPFLLAFGITVFLGFLPWAFGWKLFFASFAYAAGIWTAGTIRGNEVHRIASLVRKDVAKEKS